jgi:hypothetical protein
MKEEAAILRNKLLQFRFARRLTTRLDESLIDRAFEPRVNQILVPLLSIVKDPALRDEMRTVAAEAQASVVADRGLLAEAQVLEVLAILFRTAPKPFVSVGDVANGLTQRFGTEYQRPITSRWVGTVLRKRLNIRAYKSGGVYVVPKIEAKKFGALCARYGINPSEEVGT